MIRHLLQRFIIERCWFVFPLVLVLVVLPTRRGWNAEMVATLPCFVVSQGILARGGQCQSVRQAPIETHRTA